MKIVNIDELEEESWTSPKGKFGGSGRQVSAALGRDPMSMDLMKRHPFDLEVLRLKPGQTPYPYHSHSAQWEFYLVQSGSGTLRHDDGESEIREGDAFLFKPDEAHQLTNTGDEDLLVFVIADNPVGETCHYPDSGKWLVRSPGSRLIRSEALDYYDGEE
jgi:uncharacterized cupin superfamily protein